MEEWRGARVAFAARQPPNHLTARRCNEITVRKKSYTGYALWREAGFGPGRTTRGREPCGASETRRQATAGLAELAGRLRLATGAARREHGKDARRRVDSRVGARRSQATRDRKSVV